MKNTIKSVIVLVLLTSFSLSLGAQELTQTIRGTVFDEVSEFPLPGVNVLLLNTDPILGAATGIDGSFKIENVPIGRYDVRISFIGYEAVTIPNILVHTGKSTEINVPLVESATQLEDIVITGTRPKDLPINEMAAVSARSFTVEETRRYAGGLDDPARMAASFAGVSSSSAGENGIIIRGNAPKSLQWRMEGIEIPSPSHFAGSSVAGAGLVTMLSNQVLANSDFLTGAFPSEYGNALSGVFDLKMRNGNREEHEHAFQVGTLGIDLASEGPFSKNGKSSYLFNYRYSTLGLIEPFLPEDVNTIRYQDLSFKLNFPTKAGEFSLWGIGGKDFSKKNEEVITDPAEVEFEEDIQDFEFGFNQAATGISHKINLSENTLLQTSIAGTVNDAYWDIDRLNEQNILQPESRVENLTGTVSGSMVLNHKFSRKHATRTGVMHHQHFFDLDINETVEHQLPLENKVDADGWSGRWQFFHQSKYRLTDDLTLNAGAHSQYFALNEQITLEPRVSLTWGVDGQRSLSFGYGNHSQIEDMKIYQLTDETGTQPNQDLKLSRAHHFVISYDWVINENMRLKVEPYFQYLYDVPVIADSTFSMLNFEQDWFFNTALENSGKGRNYGVDVTLEKFFADNFYYLVTGSLYESEYTGGDGVWRDARFNRNYTFNALVGKEWAVNSRKNKLIGFNARLNMLGGKHISPLDNDASIRSQEEVLNENSAFSDREASTYQLDLTLTHRKNKPKHSSVWAIQLKNALGSEEFFGYRYNYQTQAMEKDKSKIMVPSISYKIEF